MNQSMDCRRLRFPPDHDALAAMLLKVGRNGREPFCLRLRKWSFRRVDLRAELPSKAPGNALNFATGHWQTMLGHGSSKRRRAFDDIQAVHLGRSGRESASIGELPRVTETLWMFLQKVRFQRQNYFRFVEPI